MNRILLALALALAIAAPAAAVAQDWNKGTPIGVTMTNDRFSPARLTLTHGRAYILRIRNTSDRKHNFSAPQFFKFARVAPRDSGWITDNKVDLAPGESATLHLIAPSTPNARYQFRSTNLLDATEKLKGAIYVR